MSQCWLLKHENEYRIYNAPEDYPEQWIRAEQLGAVVEELVSECYSVLVVAR